jgi:hypothetical protein
VLVVFSPVNLSLTYCEGTGYLSRRVQSPLLSLCMILKLGLMQDVRSILCPQSFFTKDNL